MSLKILQFPHPALLTPCEPVTKIDTTLLGWIDEMRQLMVDHDGAGLAANQVGLPYCIFITPDEVYINPVIKNQFGGYSEHVEGCLSLTGIHINVKRFKKVKINYYRLSGEEITTTLSGYNARVVAHECDHLQALLFFNRVDPDLYIHLGMTAKIGTLQHDYYEQVKSGSIDLLQIQYDLDRLRLERTNWKPRVSQHEVDSNICHDDIKRYDGSAVRQAVGSET